MPPSLSRASATQSPALKLACLAIASGIRTARLFPHFETVVSFRICIYFEYTSDTHAIHPSTPGFRTGPPNPHSQLDKAVRLYRDALAQGYFGPSMD
jgi:hypothetical protein